MKKADSSEVENLRNEYTAESLGKGRRGKYTESYRSGTNLVLVAPDVADAYPTDEAVNEALRSLMSSARAV